MKSLNCIFFILLPVWTLAQAVVYSENCGNPSSTTSVSTYTGWQQNGTYAYSGNADVRSTLPSNTYSGASGLGNVFITSTVNTNVTISGINTTNYNNLTLTFGFMKTTNASNGSQLAIEVSTDGTAWTSLGYLVPPPTGGGTANVWRLLTAGGTIPSAANLRIRFRMTTVVTGLQFRIDDIKLTGCPLALAPTITVNSSYCDSAVISLPECVYLQTTSTGTSTTLGNVVYTSGTYYARTRVTQSGCSTVWSEATAFIVNIKNTPSVTVNPQAEIEANEGDVVKFIAHSTDSFVWQVSSDQLNWSTIPGSANRDTLTLVGVTLLMDSEYYRILATNLPCYEVPSSVGLLKVNPSLLPITLISFNGTFKDGRSFLFWATASEVFNDRFEIERSHDAINWELIGKVSGAGFSFMIRNYKFVDLDPQKGYNYYRLKQVDFNGDYEYFKIICLYADALLPKEEDYYYDLLGRRVSKYSSGFKIKR